MRLRQKIGTEREQREAGKKGYRAEWWREPRGVSEDWGGHAELVPGIMLWFKCVPNIYELETSSPVQVLRLLGDERSRGLWPMTGRMQASQGSMAGVAPLPSSQADRLLSPDTGSQLQTSRPPGLQERNLYSYNISYSVLSILLEQQKKTETHSIQISCPETPDPRNTA